MDASQTIPAEPVEAVPVLQPVTAPEAPAALGLGQALLLVGKAMLLLGVLCLLAVPVLIVAVALAGILFGVKS